MKAVIFDLFETLVTEWGRYKYTTRDVAADLGIDYQKFRAEWERMHHFHYIGEFDSTERILNHILSIMGEKPQPDATKTIGEKREQNKARCFAAINPDVLSMLDTLQKRDYKLGLISNCSPEEIRMLHGCALKQYFTQGAMILSCDVGLVKPDRAIYELCLGGLGVQASDCLYVGDGGSNELAGAQAMGMTPVKAAWFIKAFVAGFDADKTYPLAYEPSDVIKYLE